MLPLSQCQSVMSQDIGLGGATFLCCNSPHGATQCVSCTIHRPIEAHLCSELFHFCQFYNSADVSQKVQRSFYTGEEGDLVQRSFLEDTMNQVFSMNRFWFCYLTEFALWKKRDNVIHWQKKNNDQAKCLSLTFSMNQTLRHKMHLLL